MNMVYSNVKYKMKGCYGNPRYYVSAYCFALYCPVTVDCEIERKKRRKEQNGGL